MQFFGIDMHIWPNWLKNFSNKDKRQIHEPFNCYWVGVFCFFRRLSLEIRNWKQMQTDWVRKIHFDFEQTVHGSYNVVNMLFFSIRQTNFKVLWFRRVFNKWNKNQIKKQYVRKSSVRWKSLETRNWNAANFQIDSNNWKDDRNNHFNHMFCNILRASSCEVCNSGCDTLFDWIHRTALV